jgi:transcriptional regulator with XRE-family HTH domain
VLLSAERFRAAFGRRLRDLRLQRELSIVDLAALIGMASHQQLSALERGEHIPRFDVVVRLANALQTSTDALRPDREEPPCGRAHPLGAAAVLGPTVRVSDAD